MALFDNISLNGANEVSKAHETMSKSLRNMASGLRINSAGDDASGLAVRELLRADIATARQSSRNVQDGISMLQTAEGSAGQVSKILTRMKQLATQASNGTYSDQQKNIMQQEFQQLSEEVARIVDSTTFNGVQLHQAGQSIDIAVGDGETISINTESMAVGSADLVNDAAGAAVTVNTAINQVSSYRGSLGASMNRLASTASVLDIRAENLLAAESGISDVDMASSVASMTASKIRLNVALASQAQAETISQAITMLLG
jgi:flagellin